MNNNSIFSQLNRKETVNKFQNDNYDLLIIGGGITGAGIALDASSRGLKTALIEKQDFAAGTSSRSTKLVHGGLRYLESLEFGLVREVGTEREIVHKNAPHLVIPTKMLLPLIKKGSLNRFTSAIGLTMYDFLAKVKKSERRKILSKAKTLDIEPLLKKDILKGGVLYYEYKTNDSRLVIETLKKAATYGNLALNYCSFKNFIYKNNNISGAVAYDLIENKEFEINAKIVINATGPWVDNVRQKDHKIEGKRLHITKGIHIVIPSKKLPINNAIYFDVGDGRMIFTIPKNNKAYIGTTDTDYEGNFENPKITKDDVSYLLRATNNLFNIKPLNINDIESSWVGLRPLIHKEGQAPSEMSRKDEVFISDSGLLSIAGGKLTGYRKMAEKIVDIAVKKLKKTENLTFLKCKTKTIPLSGGDLGFYPEILKIRDYADTKYDEVKRLGISFESFLQLFYKYGTNVNIIVNKAFEIFSTIRDPELAFFKAEIWYSVHYEMLYFPEDFFIRRTEMIFFEHEKSKQLLRSVLTELSEYFKWNQKIIDLYEQQYLQKTDDALLFK